MSDDPPSGTHVVLGTGQVGRPVAAELVERGAPVRVVNRSGTAPSELGDGVEAVAADVAVVEEARQACEGASVVYFCVQAPYDRWPELFPPLLDGALDGAATADARFVMADNLYAYGPVSGPIHEDLPYDPSGPKGRTRADVAETVLAAHEDGRIEATIGRASDFYGPGVVDSLVGERVFPQVVDGGTVWFPGDPDVPHTYTYVRDFARALVLLGADDAAAGEAWHVPSAETPTTREFVSLAGDVAGTDPTVRGMPSWLLRTLGTVVSSLGELSETRYQRVEPFVASHEKFADTFDLEPTPHREALASTIEWYRQRKGT